MRRAIGSPTKAQQAYQDAARALGCVVCLFRIRHGMQRPIVCGHVHIHHRNIGDMHGQKQLGHDSVVSLGAWHHDGVMLPGYVSSRTMREVFGPSFKANARDFRVWTADVLPGYGRGTEGWQRWQDEELERLQGRAA